MRASTAQARGVPADVGAGKGQDAGRRRRLTRHVLAQQLVAGAFVLSNADDLRLDPHLRVGTVRLTWRLSLRASEHPAALQGGGRRRRSLPFRRRPGGRFQTRSCLAGSGWQWAGRRSPQRLHEGRAGARESTRPRPKLRLRQLPVLRRQHTAHRSSPRRRRRYPQQNPPEARKYSFSPARSM
jgi:hypothetical protein